MDTEEETSSYHQWVYWRAICKRQLKSNYVSVKRPAKPKILPDGQKLKMVKNKNLESIASQISKQPCSKRITDGGWKSRSRCFQLVSDGGVWVTRRIPPRATPSDHCAVGNASPRFNADNRTTPVSGARHGFLAHNFYSSASVTPMPTGLRRRTYDLSGGSPGIHAISSRSLDRNHDCLSP